MNKNIDECEYIKNIINNGGQFNYDINKLDIINILDNIKTMDNFDIIHNCDSMDYYCTNVLFNSERISHISIEKYIESILKFSQCSIEYLIISIIYLKRLLNTKKIILTNKNKHYLILISIILAIYYLDDDHYHVSYYAKYSKISSTHQIDKMIIKYLQLINWNIYI